VSLKFKPLSNWELRLTQPASSNLKSSPEQVEMAEFEGEQEEGKKEGVKSSRNCSWDTGQICARQLASFFSDTEMKQEWSLLPLLLLLLLSFE
jgi:hypothetical protein